MPKIVEYIKEEDFFKVLKAEKKKEYKLCYLLAFGSGLRISEVIGLGKLKSRCCNVEVSMDKVEGSKKRISVCGSCKKQLSQKEMFRDDTDMQIQPLTKDNIDMQSKTIKIVGGKGEKDRLVPLFPNFKEDYLKMLPLKIKRITLQVHFSSLCKKVLGKPYTFHQLRHGFAVSSIKKGVKLPFLQMALGHSRLDTTGIYTRSNPEDMIEDYKNAWNI